MNKNKENKQVVGLEMLRRITGYLVSDVKFWNEAKKSELKDRTKHVGVDSNINTEKEGEIYE